MTFNNLIDTTKQVAYKVAAKVEKNAPELLAVAGVVGAVTGIVLACKATIDAEEVIEGTKVEVENIHNEYAHDPEFTTKDKQKALTTVYAKATLNVALLYSPAVLAEVLSIYCFLYSNDILKKRNTALLAAYTTLDGCFKDYRKRVVERYGEKADHDLYYNIRTEKIEQTEIDPKTGKEKKKKVEVEIADPNLANGYARYFDESVPDYERNSDMNLYFLRAKQIYANHELAARGHLFLNDVYRAIGFPETKAGQIVGWTYSADGVNEDGDQYVDFRTQEVNRLNEKGELEKVFLLDFNVEGPIIDKI